MQLLALQDLIDLLERMKRQHPEFSPILDQIATEATDLAGVTVSNEIE